MAEGGADDQPTGCFICDKHRQGDAAEGGVLYQDALVYAGHIHTMGQHTAYRGWLVIEPKRHTAALGELTVAEASALGVLVNRLARILKEGTNAEHVYAFVYGDAVKHLHVHLAPRYPDTPREYWGARVNRWPSAPRVNEQQMREFVASLRARL
jgi:histidine triad (HIT) family protein